MAPIRAAKVVADADTSATDTISEDSVDTATGEEPTLAGATIELGTIRSSKAFFFIVRNVGGSAIENLRITTDNPQISMTPGFIPVLETDGNSSLVQIAELDLIHGMDIGTRKTVKPLLPYGNSITKIFFDGISDGDSIHEEFSISYNAIYINIIQTTDSTAIAGPEMKFGDDECSFYIIDKWDAKVEQHLQAGDTVLGGFSASAGDEDSRLLLAKTDCVIKNQLPKELQ